jgi:hypothetical protein
VTTVTDAPDRSISVVICTYTEDRWDDLVAAVTSARAQTTVRASTSEPSVTCRTRS